MERIHYFRLEKHKNLEMSEKASKRVLERCIPNISSEVPRSKAERLIFNGNQWMLESLGHCTLYIYIYIYIYICIYI